MTQSINTPIGYRQLVALNKQLHRFALAKERSYQFCAHINALPLVISEFPLACHAYPIVFVSAAGKTGYGAAAVTGLKADQNLFCDAEGAWRANTYIPAYARAYPFCLATVIDDDKPRTDKMVCIAAEAVAENGQELFAEDGEPTALWRGTEKLLQEYENDTARTAAMCKELKNMGLLKEFGIQATNASKENFSLTGMVCVDEAALAKLSAAQFRKLINEGWMEKIYAHLISLRNFQALAGNA